MELVSQLKMYLNLTVNKHSRKRLMESPNAIPLEGRTEVFAAMDDSVSTTYYLTRIPWLVQGLGRRARCLKCEVPSQGRFDSCLFNGDS